MGLISISWALAIIASLAIGQVSPIPTPIAATKDVQPNLNMVAYVTKHGRTLTAEEMRSRIRMGVPIHIECAGKGHDRRVERVVLDED
jgi:hypothetical protein